MTYRRTTHVRTAVRCSQMLTSLRCCIINTNAPLYVCIPSRFHSTSYKLPSAFPTQPIHEKFTQRRQCGEKRKTEYRQSLRCKTRQKKKTTRKFEREIRGIRSTILNRHSICVRPPLFLSLREIAKTQTRTATAAPCSYKRSKKKKGGFS